MGLVALALLALLAPASPLTRPDVTALIEEAGGSLPLEAAFEEGVDLSTLAKQGLSREMWVYGVCGDLGCEGTISDEAFVVDTLSGGDAAVVLRALYLLRTFIGDDRLGWTPFLAAFCFGKLGAGPPGLARGPILPRVSGRSPVRGAPGRPLPPDQFCCPITHELLVDPVCTVDGHIYERAAIEHWLTQHDTSPLTGIELQSSQLIPQHSLRSLVAEWRASHT